MDASKLSVWSTQTQSLCRKLAELGNEVKYVGEMTDPLDGFIGTRWCRSWFNDFDETLAELVVKLEEIENEAWKSMQPGNVFDVSDDVPLRSLLNVVARNHGIQPRTVARAYNRLKWIGVMSLSQLAERSDADLLRISGFGAKCVELCRLAVDAQIVADGTEEAKS